MGEASEAWHAARVIVLQPLEQLAQFLLPFLFPQQPHLVLLLQSLPGGGHRGPHILRTPEGSMTPSFVVHPRGWAVIKDSKPHC